MKNRSSVSRGGGRLEGRTLGEFVVKRLLAEGGGGTLYLAFQPRLSRQAIIKVMHAKSGKSADVVERFKREALIASHVGHPYAAHIYSYGAEPDGLLWIAMEYIPGIDLDKYLTLHGPIPLGEFIVLFERICEVVDSLHRQNIIHRDLKPHNIMISRQAEKPVPRLIDLGIAKALDIPGQHAAGDDDNRSPGELTMLTNPDGSGASITHSDHMLGSPRYMAPEQWHSQETVDKRVDIYALGALAYEALTTRYAFTGKDIFELADAHANKPRPRLDDSFPAGLNDVIARALATRPEDRYQSALDLAAGMRRASGLFAEPEPVPRLDAELRRQNLDEAPHPLAEAVAALDAARSVYEAVGAIQKIARTTARYLGLVALACRTRTGPVEKLLDVEIHEWLRRLRRGDLDAFEWLELAGVCCRPFAGASEPHPIRELAAALHPPDGPSPIVAAVEAILDAGGDRIRAATAKSDTLQERLDALAELLQAVRFLNHYTLVVGRSDRVESWMGIRRAQQRSMPIQHPSLLDGRAALVDANHRPVVMLWPLVQMAPATPEAQDSMFLFAGKGRYGARFVAEPSGFEFSTESVWTWMSRYFFVDDSEADEVPDEDECPYQGLSAFTHKHRDLFFGREKEVEAVHNRLRQQPFMCFVGPSGAGKSSLVQAGLLPAMEPEWRAIILRPGRKPLASLQGRLEREGLVLPEFETTLADDPDALGAYLRSLAEKSDQGIILVIDQFEELLTLSTDHEQRVFAEALSRAARAAEEPVRVLVTLRDDFLIRAEALPGLHGRLSQDMHIVNTPLPGDLMRILMEPARRAGYEFEDMALPQEMVESVVDRPGALALLSFTAATLWARRDRHFKQLTREAYEAMGGVGGALAQHAEETMSNLDSESLSLVRRIFRELVTAEGTRAVLTRAEILDVLEAGADRVLETLINARLLVVSDDEDSEERIEITHEALLHAWPRLVRWRNEDKAGDRLRKQLRVIAQQWDERGRPRGMLWRGDALAEYQLWRSRDRRSRDPNKLTRVEIAFVQASEAEAQRGRRLTRAGVTAAITILALTTALLVWMNMRTEEQRKFAEEQRTLAEEQRKIAENQRTRAEKSNRALLEEQGRQALIAGNPMGALVFLNEAYGRGEDRPRLRWLMTRSIWAVKSQLLSLDGHQSRVAHARFAPDGRYAATAGGLYDPTVKIWDVQTGDLLCSLNEHKDAIESLEFSPDGTRILSASRDGVVKLWELGACASQTTPPSQKTLNPDIQRITGAEFSADGVQVIIGGESGAAVLWNTHTDERRKFVTGGRVAFAALSPDSKLVATGSNQGLAVWDVASGRSLFTRPVQAVWILDFDPAGERLITVSRGSASAVVWDVRKGRKITTLQGHRGEIRSAQFSPEGDRILTAGMDRTAKIWSAARGSLMVSLDGHEGPVEHASFSKDGAWVITASRDRTARIWDAASGNVRERLIGHIDSVSRAELSPDGRRAITASGDNTAKIWTTNIQGLAWSSSPRDAEGAEQGGAVGAVFSPDSARVLVVKRDGSVALRDTATGRVIRKFAQLASQPVSVPPFRTFDGASRIAAFSPSGDRIAVPHGKGAVILDVATGTITATLEGHKDLVTSVAFSPDGSRVVTTSFDYTAHVWDAQTGKKLFALEGHSGELWAARFSPDGHTILTASFDNTARLWSAHTGQELRVFGKHTNAVMDIVFTPSGDRIITASLDAKIRMWNPETGEETRSFDGTTQWHGVDISPDGNLLATIGGDGQVAIWDVDTGKLIGYLGYPNEQGYSVNFSGNGDRLVTTNRNGEVRAWNVRLDARSPGEINRLVRCIVPYRLDGTQLRTTTALRTTCAEGSL